MTTTPKTIDLTPNFGGLCSTFTREIEPTTRHLLRELQDRGLEEAVCRLSILLTSVAVALSTATTAAEIEALREACAAAQTLSCDVLREVDDG